MKNVKMYYQKKKGYNTLNKILKCLNGESKINSNERGLKSSLFFFFFLNMHLILL